MHLKFAIPAEIEEEGESDAKGKGEDFTQELKREAGKSKSDLYWDKDGNIYAIPKKGGPPQLVGGAT